MKSLLKEVEDSKEILEAFKGETERGRLPDVQKMLSLRSWEQELQPQD